MQIGLVGLGRMGMNMGRRWLQGGHEVIAFNRTYAKTEELAEDVAGLELATLGDTFGDEVAPSHLGVVAGLIFRAPQPQPYSLATELLCAVQRRPGSVHSRPACGCLCGAGR